MNARKVTMIIDEAFVCLAGSLHVLAAKCCALPEGLLQVFNELYQFHDKAPPQRHVQADVGLVIKLATSTLSHWSRGFRRSKMVPTVVSIWSRGVWN